MKLVFPGGEHPQVLLGPGVNPAFTSSSISRCIADPWAVPGFPASVPARIVTPAAFSNRTVASAAA